MLSLKNISKYYNTDGNKAAVLQDISLDIDEGKFVSVMVPCIINLSDGKVDFPLNI